MCHFIRKHLDFAISQYSLSFFKLGPKNEDSKKVNKMHYIYACKKLPGADEKCLKNFQQVYISLLVDYEKESNSDSEDEDEDNKKEDESKFGLNKEVNLNINSETNIQGINEKNQITSIENAPIMNQAELKKDEEKKDLEVKYQQKEFDKN